MHSWFTTRSYIEDRIRASSHPCIVWEYHGMRQKSCMPSYWCKAFKSNKDREAAKPSAHIRSLPRTTQNSTANNRMIGTFVPAFAP